MNSKLQNATQDQIDEIRASKHWLNGVEIQLILSDEDYNPYKKVTQDTIDEYTDAWINVARISLPPVGTFIYVDENWIEIFQYDIMQDTDLTHTKLVVWCT